MNERIVMQVLSGHFLECPKHDCKYSVGALISLYEKNYKRLCQWIPDLKTIQKKDVLAKQVNFLLLLEVMEQHKYTTLIRIKYPFIEEMNAFVFDINCYHDAKVAEISPKSCFFKDYSNSSIDEVSKWRVNRFLERWLVRHMVTGYQFSLN